MERSAATVDPLEISLREQIEHGPLLVDEQEIERIAADLYRIAGGASLDALAVAAGCVVCNGDELPAKLPALLTAEGVLMVRTEGSRLAALRELAHWPLRSRPHTLGDVGRLALALAARR